MSQLASILGGTRDAGPNWVRLSVLAAPLATGNNSLVAAPGAGLKVVIDDILVTSDTAVNVAFQRIDTHAAVLPLFTLPAGSVTQVTLRQGFELAANVGFEYAAGAGVTNSGLFIGYHIEPGS